MGKNRLFQGGATKNQNKCSVFPAAYKLVHLYTNFILKHLNKNLIKPSKIKHLINLSYQIQISHPISSNPTKINTFTNLTPQFQSKIQSTFFLYKYENPKKIHTFTDYKFFTKFTCKSTSNFLYLTSENYYLT